MQIDAFTSEPFRGNPAAVCLLDRDRDEGWMQQVAAEMNLAETAFVLRRDDGFSLRWFTPTVEVPLCGHATLASAHALWEEEILGGGDEARFHSRSGVLTAQRRDGWIELNFPRTPHEPTALPEGLTEALGLDEPPLAVERAASNLLLQLREADLVRGLRPDTRRLLQFPAKAISVTSRGDEEGIDFVSRFFAPALGVDEDPVTGSAHCYLTPFWASRLGRTAMTALQVSPRGGLLRVRLEGERVVLAGQAVTVFAGHLNDGVSADSSTAGA